VDDNVAVKGVRLVTLLVQNNEMSQDQVRSLHPCACSRYPLHSAHCRVASEQAHAGLLHSLLSTSKAKCVQLPTERRQPVRAI
jgi:hypothetical protein